MFDSCLTYEESYRRQDVYIYFLLVLTVSIMFVLELLHFDKKFGSFLKANQTSFLS